MADNLETFMWAGENEDVQFQINKSDNSLWVNGQKVVTEEKIKVKGLEKFLAILVAVGTFGSFIVQLYDKIPATFWEFVKNLL